MKNRITIFIPWMVILFILQTNIIVALAQDNLTIIHGLNDSATYGIKWIKQFPSIENQSKVGIVKHLFDFFFAKNTFELSKPVSIMATNPDTFWVLDQGNMAIFHVESQMIENPQLPNNSLEQLTSLIGICSTPYDEILFTDSRLNKIFLISAEKKEIRILNDSLILNQPTGIAYSRITNEIWVVETAAHQISVLNDKGDLIRKIGKRGNGPDQFNFPTFIWIDNAGITYIIDAMNFRVKLYDINGELISYFGEIGDATGYFARPKGIATDSYGNIYIVDALFHAVQIFDKTGKFLYYFGNQGRGKGEFWMPTGIYIDEEDYIYVADSYNSRVQVFQLTNLD